MSSPKSQQQSFTTISTSSSATAIPYKQRQWFIDFTRKPDRLVVAHDGSTKFVAPIGYSDHQINDVVNHEEGTRLNDMRSWEIALGPIKQAPMNVLISWMSGNSISLFPIMFIGMLLFRPFQSIFAMSKAFEAIECDNKLLLKAIYIFGNIVNLVIALYKCHSMGLLPTYASDWLAFANPQIQMEYSAGGFSFN